LEKLRGIADEKIGHIPGRSMPSTLGAVFRYSEIAEAVEAGLVFDERESVEHDLSSVQLIPIAVIKDRGSSRLLVARKAEKAVSPKSPERRKVLGYFGGHVREEDSNFLTSTKKLDILKQCLYREVKEEIGIDVDPADENPFCIWVRDGTKSENHLAVVFVVERDLNNTRVSVDGEELVRYEKKGITGTGAVVSFDHVLRKEKTDSWTTNIIEKILAHASTTEAYQKALFENMGPQ
jgi:predicted NUDIX family phosphoesterase